MLILSLSKKQFSMDFSSIHKLSTLLSIAAIVKYIQHPTPKHELLYRYSNQNKWNKQTTNIAEFN
jgi:hypothetical protein